MRSEPITDRERLEQEIRGEIYAALLRNLQQTDAFLGRFSKWEDVVAFMREGTSDDALKDHVLRPILTAHAVDKDPRWRSVLLVIFWPGLDSIANRRRSWDPDAQERWQNLVWAFLQTVANLDPTKRPNRYVQKIINDTFHKFHDKYRRAWNHAEREVATDPE